MILLMIIIMMTVMNLRLLRPDEVVVVFSVFLTDGWFRPVHLCTCAADPDDDDDGDGDEPQTSQTDEVVVVFCPSLTAITD